MNIERDKVIFELGSWLSASLEDNNVCSEFKDAVNAWFELPDVNAIISNYEPDDAQLIEPMFDYTIEDLFK